MMLCLWLWEMAETRIGARLVGVYGCPGICIDDEEVEREDEDGEKERDDEDGRRRGGLGTFLNIVSQSPPEEDASDISAYTIGW